MLQTWIHRIKPGKEERIREWLTEMNTTRANDVRESLAAAGVRAEQAFVVSGVTGAILIYVSDAADQAHAARVYAASTFAIDTEHRQVMDECIEHTLSDPPVYDVSA